MKIIMLMILFSFNTYAEGYMFISSQSVFENRLKVYVGTSPKETPKYEKEKWEVDRGGVFGVGYSRMLTSKLGVEFLGFSNKTYAMGLSIGF